MKNNNYGHSNPLEEEKIFKSLVSFFHKFDNFFSNEKVDEIVKREFAQEYALLPLLVKAKMYYNEQ